MKTPAYVLLVLVSGSMWWALGRSEISPAAFPSPPLAPVDNPTTPARVVLGRLLFWDPLLSGSKDVACATCHHPAFGYSDGLRLSVGVNGKGLGVQRTFIEGAPVHFVKRNSQTVLNTAFNGLAASGSATPSQAPMFWDLRVSGLEAQALEPIKSADEMRGDAYTEAIALNTVVARIRAIPSYVTLFDAAFGGGRASVTAANVGRALAAFERSLVAVNSPYDRYMRGDQSAMTAEQVAGMQAFQRVGCANCHSGPMFSDFQPHVLGVPANGDAPVLDAGINDTGAFRTPTLRNLGSTGPYMHSGVFASLGEVVQFYNRAGRGRGGRGGNNAAQLQLDPLLRQLRGVQGSGREIAAFLTALNDDNYDRTIPERVPSGLQPGGRIN